MRWSNRGDRIRSPRLLLELPPTKLGGTSQQLLTQPQWLEIDGSRTIVVGFPNYSVLRVLESPRHVAPGLEPMPQRFAKVAQVELPPRIQTPPIAKDERIDRPGQSATCLNR
jgi:hypothetical protein